MDENQKISILLAEYNTLRAEVMAARSYVAQAAGITAGVLMGVLGLSFSAHISVARWAALSIGIIAIVYLGGSFVWNEINTRKFIKRLRGLEKDINDSGWRAVTGLAYHRPRRLNSLVGWHNRDPWRDIWSSYPGSC